MWERHRNIKTSVGLVIVYNVAFTNVLNNQVILDN